MRFQRIAQRIRNLVDVAGKISARTGYDDYWIMTGKQKAPVSDEGQQARPDEQGARFVGPHHRSTTTGARWCEVMAGPGESRSVMSRTTASCSASMTLSESPTTPKQKVGGSNPSVGTTSPHIVQVVLDTTPRPMLACRA